MLASETDKHWSRGYISGSFDMFHIGHLNLIRRSKERCDYLLVGVLTDELVANKGKWPMMPLKDRMEIIAALKYVDEVDVTTQPLLNKLTAWEKYRFDAMFSGDDHMHDGWSKQESELKALGADLVFFPYTKEISSTRLHERLPTGSAVKAVKPKKIGEFRYVFPFDKVSKGERIAIYGAGNVGIQYLRQLESLDFCEVAAIADISANPGDTFEGKKLIPPEKLVENPDMFDRVVIASTKYHAQMTAKLRALGMPQEKIV